MGFSHPRRTQDDHVVAAFDEAQPGQLAHLPAVQAGLEVEIELVEGFDPGEARLAQPGFDATLVAPLPFGRQRLGQEGLVVLLALGSLFADRIQLRFQVIHLQLVEQVVQFHWVTSSYTCKGRCSTFKASCHRAAWCSGTVTQPSWALRSVMDSHRQLIQVGSRGS